MKKVLFVCLGNICRSTMAEGVFRNIVEKRGLQNQIICDSAGTSNYHIGERADSRTLQVLAEKGIELPHLGRQLQLSDFDDFDYILAMDKNNLRDIQKLAIQKKDFNAQIHLMTDFDESQIGGEVPDPYYGNIQDFKHVYEIVYSASLGLINKLNSGV